LHWHRLWRFLLIVLFTEPNNSEGLTKFEPKAIRLSALFNEFTIFWEILVLFYATRWQNTSRFDSTNRWHFSSKLGSPLFSTNSPSLNSITL
jgi:hypothetical protein